MTNREKRQRLQAIVDVQGKGLTADDKQFIAETAEELGVEFAPKSRCKSCYFDAAILCLVELKKQGAQVETEKDERAYVLRPGLDVRFGDVRVNEYTLTDDLARELIARGFDKKFFVKCE